MADPTLAELIAAHEETVSTGNPALLNQLATIVQLSVLTGARVSTFGDLERYVENALGQSFEVWRRAQVRAGDLLRETQVPAA